MKASIFIISLISFLFINAKAHPPKTFKIEVKNKHKGYGGHPSDILLYVHAHEHGKLVDQRTFLIEKGSEAPIDYKYHSSTETPQFTFWTSPHNHPGNFYTLCENSKDKSKKLMMSTKTKKTSLTITGDLHHTDCTGEVIE